MSGRRIEGRIEAFAAAGGLSDVVVEGDGFAPHRSSTRSPLRLRTTDGAVVTVTTDGARLAGGRAASERGPWQRVRATPAGARAAGFEAGGHVEVEVRVTWLEVGDEVVVEGEPSGVEPVAYRDDAPALRELRASAIGPAGGAPPAAPAPRGGPSVGDALRVAVALALAAWAALIVLGFPLPETPFEVLARGLGATASLGLSASLLRRPLGQVRAFPCAPDVAPFPQMAVAPRSGPADLVADRERTPRAILAALALLAVGPGASACLYGTYAAGPVTAPEAWMWLFPLIPLALAVAADRAAPRDARARRIARALLSASAREGRVRGPDPLTRIVEGRRHVSAGRTFRLVRWEMTERERAEPLLWIDTAEGPLRVPVAQLAWGTTAVARVDCTHELPEGAREPDLRAVERLTFAVRAGDRARVAARFEAGAAVPAGPESIVLLATGASSPRGVLLRALAVDAAPLAITAAGILLTIAVAALVALTG